MFGFDLGGLISDTLSGWLGWFPFGSQGLVFTVGLILGAWLGRAAVAMLIGAFLAVIVAGKAKSEPFAGTPFGETPPKRIRRTAKRTPRKTIFDALRGK